MTPEHFPSSEKEKKLPLHSPERVAFNPKNETLILKVDPALLDSPFLAELASREGLQRKNELHITVIGSRAAKFIKDLLKGLPDAEREEKNGKIESLVRSADWRFVTEGQDVLRVKKEYPASKEGGEKETREAIIKIVQVPEMERFYGELNGTLGTELTAPPPHVTLYTGGSDPESSRSGIGIDTPAALEGLGPEKVEIPER